MERILKDRLSDNVAKLFQMQLVESLVQLVLNSSFNLASNLVH